MEYKAVELANGHIISEKELARTINVLGFGTYIGTEKDLYLVIGLDLDVFEKEVYNKYNSVEDIMNIALDKFDAVVISIEYDSANIVHVDDENSIGGILVHDHIGLQQSQIVTPTSLAKSIRLQGMEVFRGREDDIFLIIGMDDWRDDAFEDIYNSSDDISFEEITDKVLETLGGVIIELSTLTLTKYK